MSSDSGANPEPSAIASATPSHSGHDPAALRRRAWLIVASLFVTVMVMFGGMFVTFGLFFNPLVKAFHWDHTQVALLLTVECLFIAGASPFVGWALERWQARFVIALGAILAVGALLLASTAHSFYVMAFAYMVLGIAVACSSFIPLPIVVAQWFAENRGLAMGIAIAGAPFGGIVMTEVVSHAILSIGWRAGYLALAAPALFIVLPLVLLVVRNEPTHAHEHGGEHGAMLPGYTIVEALGRRVFWLLVAAGLCYGFIVALGLAHLVEYLIGVGYSPASAAGIFALVNVAAFLGCLVAGWIGDHVGNRVVVTFMLLLMMAAYVALLDVRNPAAMGLFLLGFGFSGAAPTALFMLVMAEAVGLKHFAFFSGLLSLAMTLGNAIGPVAGGRMFDAAHSYSPAFVLAAGLGLIGAALVIALPKLRFVGARDPEPEGEEGLAEVKVTL